MNSEEYPFEVLGSIAAQGGSRSPLAHNLELDNRYLDEQQDPVIGHNAGRISLERNDDGWQLSSSLPLQMLLPSDASLHPINWYELSQSETQGNALWKYSLGYLPALMRMPEGAEATRKILRDAWAWTMTEEWRSRSAWMTSLDHCVATRLRAMALLRVHYENFNEDVPAEVYNFVNYDSRFVIENTDKMFPNNNHGAMAAIAAIHASFIFPELDSAVQSETPFDSIARASLLSILDAIFDEFGIANENSPEYQRYWISLLGPLGSLDELVSDSAAAPADRRGFQSQISERLKKVTGALDSFIDNNSRMVAIGDTHPRRVRSDMRNGFMVSEPSGFATYRSGGTYFTFNAGSTNYAHKHCDDLSVTLQRNGTNILLDSGFFGHDWNDPKVIYTKSQDAHSGLFFEGLDGLHPGKLYFPGRERIRATLESRASDGFHVRGRVWVDGRLSLERSVQLLSEKILEIRDRVYETTPELGRAWKRFIVPLGSQISFDKFRVAIETGEQTLEIFSDIIDTAEVARVVSGAEQPRLRGWVSPELNELVPSTCLELPCEVGGVSTIRLVMS